MSDIEIVYLTFNRLNLNKLSLPALLNSDPDIDYKVSIYDNGSTDGTVEWLKTLDHPKIKDITFKDKNYGIAPITNEFWKKTNATYIGKIDNDLIVPENWIRDVMLRLENAEEDKVGSVTLYHWVPEWTNNLDVNQIPIVTLKNGSQMALSTHTGGNYIFHRYLIDLWGYVHENRGLKGGFTLWQYQGRGNIKNGYIYPFRYFTIPELIKSWNGFKERGIVDKNNWMNKEIREATRLLQFPKKLFKM